MCRALSRALAASGTLCVIDDSNVVIHMDRIELTLLCAERTSDTACLADLLDSRSFVVGAALYEVVCLVRNKLDQVTRTSLRALTAGNALLLVDNGNAVYNMDRVELTCLYTASGTEASVVTSLGSAARNCICNLVAVINTVVIVFNSRLIAGTFTFYKRNFLLSGTSLNAHNRSDLLAYRSAADRTLINFCFALPICGR